ncbi:MAG: murein biosynthesis integral membrane protein MurJ [Patescibacteria group bacterium]
MISVKDIAKKFSREALTGGAAILSITTFLSYVTGLARDRIFSRTFGAGHELDVYNASFIIPDLLMNILVASMLSAAFIPMFTGLFARGDKEHANELANTVLNSACTVIIIFGGIAAIFMPYLVHFVAPGFSPEQRETLTWLSRLMLISPVLMTISNSLGSMLIGFKKFLGYGISPILYNLGIICGALLFVPIFGIYGLVMGTLIGGLFHLLPRLIAILRSPFRYSFQFKLRSPHFIKVIKLTIPKMFGQPVEQLTFLGFTRIATLLAAGSVSVISFARNFQSVPVALFGIAFATAVFPILSECAAKGDRVAFIANFWKALRNILIFTIPSALGLYFLSELPIRIFLGGGKFMDEDILRTATVLSAFAFSIPTESLIHLLARSFYALKNTIIPVLFSVLNLAISVSFAYFKHKELGIVAIPYGFFLGSLCEILALALILRIKIKALRQS